MAESYRNNFSFSLASASNHEDFISEFLNLIHPLIVLDFGLDRVASFSGQVLGFGDVYRNAVAGDAEAKGFAYVNRRADKRSNELHLPGVLHASDRAHRGKD